MSGDFLMDLRKLPVTPRCAFFLMIFEGTAEKGATQKNRWTLHSAFDHSTGLFNIFFQLNNKFERKIIYFILSLYLSYFICL
jgi:hypothetical protein